MQYKDTLMWQELNLAPQVLETLVYGACRELFE